MDVEGIYKLYEAGDYESMVKEMDAYYGGFARCINDLHNYMNVFLDSGEEAKALILIVGNYRNIKEGIDVFANMSNEPIVITMKED